MSTKYEEGTATVSSSSGMFASNWHAQTFTAISTHTVSSVKVRMYREGTITTLTASLRATDSNGQPTGADLVSGTVDVSALPTSGSGMAEVTFALPYTITSGIVYAIVVRLTGGNGSNELRVQTDSSGVYTGGARDFSNTAGVTWTGLSTDLGFEVWGGPASTTDKTYSKALIAIGNDEVWRESVAGTMAELTDANGDVDTASPLNATVAFQKLFIANGTNLKIADFVNTKLTTSDIAPDDPGNGDYLPPDRGIILTGGTSGAEMIVDYITAIDGACVIYGKRTTTATFIDTEEITGTNPSTSPYAGTVTFDLTANEVAPPHWYSWTVYGADATNFGIMPVRANQVCNFMGCLMLAGDPNYPHQWYMSRQFNPFDWLYAQDDAQSAEAGNDADAGEIGDILKVNIPYKDDFVVHACASTLWYMTGHPCVGGTIVELDLTTGILGDRAFCWDDVGNLYMVCTVGLLRIPPGFGQPQNLTIELWPDFITDLAFNAASHRITLAFNPEDRGIHIFKTTLADGTSSSWWYDLRTEGLFPDSYSTDHGVFSAVYYQSENPSYRKLLFGCNDGYIRFADRTAENDDSTAIDSYVGFAPLALSTHPRKDGIIKNIDLISGGGGANGSQSDSDDVLCSVHVARTAEKVIEKLDGGTTAAFTKTFTAPGYQRGNIDRRPIRGQWGGIVLGNATAGESWSMERLIVDTKEVGRSL